MREMVHSSGGKIFVGSATAVILSIAFMSPGQAQRTTPDMLMAARAQFVAHYPEIERRMGRDQAVDLQERLDDDIGTFLTGDTPDNFSYADWTQRLDGLARLDSSIVKQVVAGKSDAIAGASGLVERLIVARTDGTMEPFALYVPSPLSAKPTLVVLLHGKPQTESAILAGPYFQKLADMSGTIIAAPYGRGIYDFGPPADDEVYQVADAVAAAYNVSSHRVYLVGYSMGGFAVFKIGPRHGERWAAVMCIAGSVLNSEADSVSRAFRTTPIYVVNGAKDESIPPRYGQMTAEWLAGIGIQTGFYQEPTGSHFISTLMPSLTKAWHDMMAGYISPWAVPRGVAELPGGIPQSFSSMTVRP